MKNLLLKLQNVLAIIGLIAPVKKDDPSNEEFLREFASFIQSFLPVIKNLASDINKCTKNRSIEDLAQSFMAPLIKEGLDHQTAVEYAFNYAQEFKKVSASYSFEHED